MEAWSSGLRRRVGIALLNFMALAYATPVFGGDDEYLWAQFVAAITELLTENDRRGTCAHAAYMSGQTLEEIFGPDRVRVATREWLSPLSRRQIVNGVDPRTAAQEGHAIAVAAMPDGRFAALSWGRVYVGDSLDAALRSVYANIPMQSDFLDLNLPRGEFEEYLRRTRWLVESPQPPHFGRPLDPGGLTWWQRLKMPQTLRTMDRGAAKIIREAMESGVHPNDILRIIQASGAGEDAFSDEAFRRAGLRDASGFRGGARLPCNGRPSMGVPLAMAVEALAGAYVDTVISDHAALPTSQLPTKLHPGLTTAAAIGAIFNPLELVMNGRAGIQNSFIEENLQIADEHLRNHEREAARQALIMLEQTTGGRYHLYNLPSFNERTTSR